MTIINLNHPTAVNALMDIARGQPWTGLLFSLSFATVWPRGLEQTTPLPLVSLMHLQNEEVRSNDL